MESAQIPYHEFIDEASRITVLPEQISKLKIFLAKKMVIIILLGI